APIAGDLVQLREVHDRDYRLRRLLPALHVWIQISATRDELARWTSAGHDLHRLRDRSRRAVFKFGQSHHDLFGLKEFSHKKAQTSSLAILYILCLFVTMTAPPRVVVGFRLRLPPASNRVAVRASRLTAQ